MLISWTGKFYFESHFLIELESLKTHCLYKSKRTLVISCILQRLFHKLSSYSLSSIFIFNINVFYM